MRRPITTLLCAGALLMTGIACSDDEPTSSEDTSSTTTSTTAPEGPKNMDEEENLEPVEPGTYFIDPDGDPATPLRVTFEVAEEGWSAWGGTFKENDTGHTMLTITTVPNVVQDACTDHSPADPAVGPTVDDLATALTNLAPFEVTSLPSDVTLLGHQGKHLQLTMPGIPNEGGEFTGCTGGNLHSWFFNDPSGVSDDSFYGYNGEPGSTEDFWILDVDGTRLMLETNSSPATPAEDLAELQAIFDSIQFED